jgi:hypothetical protein
MKNIVFIKRNAGNTVISILRYIFQGDICLEIWRLSGGSESSLGFKI